MSADRDDQFQNQAPFPSGPATGRDTRGDSPDGIRCYAQSDAIPPCGVFAGAYSPPRFYLGDVAVVENWSADDALLLFFINKPDELSDRGRCYPADATPRLALCDDSEWSPAPAVGDACGIEPGSYKLIPDQPGFRIAYAGFVRPDTSTDTRYVWVIGDDPYAARHFELKDAHTPGDTSTAYNQSWSGTAWETDDTDSDTEFEVVDVKEIYRGRAKDAYSSPHDNGSLGTAEYNRTTGQWEMTWLQPIALRIKGLTTAAVDELDSTFDIDAVGIMSPPGAIIVDQDPGDDITVENTFSCEADDNGIVHAAWDEDTAEWSGDAIACPA